MEYADLPPMLKRYRNPWKRHFPVEFQCYRHMIQRCYLKSNPSYKNYGGRGIAVSRLWRESFPRFLADMGPRPDGFSIERVDVMGHYKQDNCKWIPKKDQPKNQRNRVSLTIFGETKSATEWTADPRCAIKSRCIRTLLRRIRSGVDPESALTTPSIRPYRFLAQEAQQ